MLIDSHCHINLPELKPQLSEILQRMQEFGVSYALAISISEDTFLDILTIVNNHPNLFASIGVHPDDINAKELSAEEIINYTTNKKVIGIGETGLDYHWCSGDLGWQHQRFIKHIEASKATNLPLIIHTRKAAIDTIRILKEQQVENAVIHCFTEDIDFAKKVLDLGLFISFSGIVTFKNAKEIQEACKYVPDDRLLIETDAPYLAPVPFRGKINQPAYVKYTAEYIAKLRNQSFEEIANITSDNFFKLFSKAKNE